MRRTVAKVAVGMVAGATLVGVPAYAAASQDDSSPQDSSNVGQMMSDPEMRKEMKSFMSDMMSDPKLRTQMQSMMSDAMEGMPMTGDGSMSKREMGDGSMSKREMGEGSMSTRDQ